MTVYISLFGYCFSLRVQSEFEYRLKQDFIYDLPHPTRGLYISINILYDIVNLGITNNFLCHLPLFSLRFLIALPVLRIRFLLETLSIRMSLSLKKNPNNSNRSEPSKIPPILGLSQVFFIFNYLCSHLFIRRLTDWL